MSRKPTKTAQRARSLKSAARPSPVPPAARAAYDLIYDLSNGVEKARLSSTPTTRARLIEGDSAYRKAFPLATGLLDYFPDACAAVAEVSFKGNQKHNPGEPMHHARGKSMDHADCIMRHLTERGGFDGDIRHSAALAWRALAHLQEELEQAFGLPLPRGAKA